MLAVQVWARQDPFVWESWRSTGMLWTWSKQTNLCPTKLCCHTWMLYHRHIDIAFHQVTFYSRQQGNWPYVLDLSFKCWALCKEASSTIFKVFGVIRLGIEPVTSHTPGKCSATGPPGAVPFQIIIWPFPNILKKNIILHSEYNSHKELEISHSIKVWDAL